MKKSALRHAQRITFILVFCVCALSSFAQTATKTITIQPKQTLYGIAREYNVSAAELKTLNPQYAPNFQMKIGDKFKIPVAGKTANTAPKTTSTETPKTVMPAVVESKIELPKTPVTESQPTTTIPVSKPTIGVHIVKKGETASVIARKYGMPLKDLLALNKLSAKDNVKIGQKLKVRTHESASAQVAPVIYKPISPTVIASATPTTSANSATKIEEKKIETPKAVVKESAPKIQEDAIFVNAVTPKEEVEKPKEIVIEKTAKKVEISHSTKVAKEAVPTDNVQKTTFVETPKDPNAPAPIKAKDLAEQSNLTSIKAPLIEQTSDIDNKKLEASFNRTINPNSKRTLRGIATVVKNSELTSSSFVLYNYAEEGDIVKVVNLMSKKVMYLKVVGKMNSNEQEAILQVSSDTAKMLQAGESRFLIEVTGY